MHVMEISMNTTAIRKNINDELDKAEDVWNKVGQLIMEKSEEYSSFDGFRGVETNIPNFPFIEEGQPKVSDFIALVYDIRGSTQHLIQAISTRTADVSQLQRVYYETTAVNTLGSLIIESSGGGITEFLGDGFLALFNVEEKPEVVYNAHNAAKNCLKYTDEIVNDILNQRYRLPNLNVGVGLAYSKAIVTLVGIGKNKHGKTIGECVYRASKLSKGFNEICIDTPLKNLWPTSKDGTLKFTQRNYNYFEGYLINK